MAREIELDEIDTDPYNQRYGDKAVTVS